VDRTLNVFDNYSRWLKYFDSQITEVIFCHENQLKMMAGLTDKVRVVIVQFPLSSNRSNFNLSEVVVSRFKKAEELVLLVDELITNKEIQKFWDGFPTTLCKEDMALRYISVSGGPDDALDRIRDHQPASSIGCSVTYYTELSVSFLLPHMYICIFF
jgi:hypothetical protein